VGESETDGWQETMMAPATVTEAPSWEYVRCAICGSDDTELVLAHSGRRLVRCRQCGLHYINPRQTTQGFDAFDGGLYPAFLVNEYKKPHSPRARWNVKRLDIIEQHIRRGKLLDVGCSAGFFLQQAKARGWDVFGVEPSAPSARYAREELGLKVITGFFDRHSPLYKRAQFDVVTMWHVLEHVPHPIKSLKEIGNVLRENGLLALEVPNIESPLFRLFKGRWYHLFLETHNYHFSARTLRVLLEKAGFADVETRVVKRTMPMSIGPSHKLLRKLTRIVNGGIIHLSQSGDAIVACARRRSRASQ
jgi:SAM-dependent methyltransferase